MNGVFLTPKILLTEPNGFANLIKGKGQFLTSTIPSVLGVGDVEVRVFGFASIVIDPPFTFCNRDLPKGIALWELYPENGMYLYHRLAIPIRGKTISWNDGSTYHEHKIFYPNGSTKCTTREVELG